MNKMNGLSYGDSVLIDGRVVNFDKKDYNCEEDGFTDEILSGGRYSASTTLLDISCSAGRWGLISELESTPKVGHFRGKTIAGYLRKYLEEVG